MLWFFFKVCFESIYICTCALGGFKSDKFSKWSILYGEKKAMGFCGVYIEMQKYTYNNNNNNDSDSDNDNNSDSDNDNDNNNSNIAMSVSRRNSKSKGVIFTIIQSNSY